MRIEFLNIGDDFTYANIAPAGWSLGELCAGVTCACLPTLRPLLFRVVTPGRSKKRVNFSRSVVNGTTAIPLRGTGQTSSKVGDVEINEVELESGNRSGRGVDVSLSTVSSTKSDDSDRQQPFRNVM